jgi:peptidoglycan/xylan/chitin deacetylase (PgdA/CDA1 family)
MFSNVHKDFNTLSKAQKQAELSKFEELVQPMIGGQSPTYASTPVFIDIYLVLTRVSTSSYFRPPYFNCNDECIEVATSMGYHVITANLDPRDYDHQDDISPSEQYFKNAFKKAKEEKSTEGYIAVMADVYVNTVKKLVPFAIKKARSKGYRSKFQSATILSYTMRGLYQRY